jgi:radical S-adenosyl methionine domain-containing protein 2
MCCQYCFAKYSGENCREQTLSLYQYCRIIEQIAQEGFSKISFAGGEPLLHPMLPELIRFTKQLGITTMLVTNGSLLNPEFLQKMQGLLDWVSISVDSLSSDTNLKIGRVLKGSGMTEEQYRQRIEWVKQSGMRLKINTVVSSANRDENFTRFINDAAPERWKVFQVLPIENANRGAVDRFLISPDEFSRFLNNNGTVKSPLIPESNSDMIDSYVMIDPQGRLYSNTDNIHRYSDPVYRCPLKQALKEAGFMIEKFIRRGVAYVW